MLRLLLFCLFSIMFTNSLLAEPVANLYSKEGEVTARVKDMSDWLAVDLGYEFENGDSVRTVRNSRAAVRFNSGFMIRLKGSSSLTFTPQISEGGPMRIQKGAAHFFSRKPKYFPKIITPQVSAVVRGTEFVVAVSDTETVISVLDGAVQAENAHGRLLVNKGEVASVKQGQAPAKQLLAKPVDAVQWTLYYPVILDQSTFAAFLNGATQEQSEAWNLIEEGAFETARVMLTGISWRDVFARSLSWYYAGSVEEAVKSLQQSTETSPLLRLYQSMLYLAVGAVDEAEQSLALLERNIQQTGANSQVHIMAGLYAQRSVIATVKGDKELAWSLAEKALAADPQSSAATLAHSYAAQSMFRLNEAQQWLQRTIELRPEAAFPRARLAELQLGFGDTDAAAETVAKALQLSEESAYAQVVKGFIELSRYETERATDAFSAALKIDPELAQGYLGLGLAMIRTGEFEVGRINIEKAAHMDPAVSAYRSYLGKAYYEEDRYGLSRNELSRAIELDPQDPTPYLYRSYLNLSDHKPVLALRDIEKSIALNNNRAVFRSSMLLDQDLGVRSVGLGTAYSKLGFSELARLEAVRALDRDYANYSAHHLLSSAYRGSDFNRQAGNSESFIARLLVPVNFNATTAASSGGSASLNEYTTLFDQPGVRARVVSENDTALRRTSIGAGMQQSENRFGWYTEGSFTYENGLNKEIPTHLYLASIGGQYQVSEKTTLISDLGFAYQDQDIKFGSIQLGTEVSTMNAENEIVDYEGGIGAHHRFGPGSDLIANVNIAQLNRDTRTNNNRGRYQGVAVVDIAGEPTVVPVFSITDDSFERDATFLDSDLQFIKRFEYVSAVLGGRYAHRIEDAEGDTTVDTLVDSTTGTVSGPITDGFVGVTSSTETDDDLGAQDAYLYTTIYPVDWLDINAGVAYNRIEFNTSNLFPPFADDSESKDKWSPKAGFSLYLPTGTTLRGAYFEKLGRAADGDVNIIEPTYVGGFNQVLDQSKQSELEFYGFGIEHKFWSGLYAGADYQNRTIDEFFGVQQSILIYDGRTAELYEQNTKSVSESELTEDRVKTYVYTVLDDHFVTTAEGFWNRADYDPADTKITTRRGAIEGRYFFENGLFATSSAVWRAQNFEVAASDVDQTETFWLFNAGFGYDLKYRGGVVSVDFQNIAGKSFSYAPVLGEGFVLPEFNVSLNLSLNF